MRTVRSFVVAALAVAMSMVAISPAWASPGVAGSNAYRYARELSIASRLAGEASELAAAGMVKHWFEEAGYDSAYQTFTYTSASKPGYSQNVVAYLPSSTRRPSAPLIIVGAHYDSVVAGDGADDNASGVGCMLEVAEAVKTYRRNYDVAFVAFGAEEVGLKGSAYFVRHMPKADRDRAVVMVNFDSLVAGDKLYIHSGENGKTKPRDRMLGIVKRLGLPIETQPGLNEHYPAGLTPDGFSDYTAFNRAGIPVTAFESTNWEIGDLDGYTQTEKFGSFWHTGKDTFATIEQHFPGRPHQRLSAYTTLVETYLLDPLR